jgi:hypothetical protein
VGSFCEASERLEGGLDLGELSARDEAAPKRLLCGLAQ